MNVTVLAFLVGTLSTAAAADIIKIETNEWGNKRPIIWTGTLQRIDSASQLADFAFRNGTKTAVVQIHITRIYSLTLDEQDRVDRAFPPTQQDLRTPLPSSPRSTEILELSNDRFVGDEIPLEVKVRPDRKSRVLYLTGTIRHGDLQKMMLEAKADNRSTSAFEIVRADLIAWIRGR